ncbi:hypothetical protein WKW50_16515 [Ochrobactrum sp. GPK 3]
MAYREHSISALSEIPALVTAFATEVGWNIAGTNTLRHPNFEGNGPGGLAFQLSSAVSGLQHTLRWTCATAPYSTKSAVLMSPIYSTVAAPTVGITQTPTKLFLISMLEPEPYIAIVVEYGYNLYRHLYLGFMEKIGNYSGGEVISSHNGTHLDSVWSTSLWHYDGGTGNPVANFLFGWNTSKYTADASGGVRVEHQDNPQTWRHFRRNAVIPASESWTAPFTYSDALGGFGDSINDAYVAKGKNALAGTSVLTPINLFVTQAALNDTRFVPIGNPAGVRLVNIEQMEAQSSAEIGDETWYVFAASRKSSDLYTRGPVSNAYRYPISESSYYLGYAYRGA